MAVNLNPGADATLVQAAYAASMANVPKDLSPIYKQMGDSYQLAAVIVKNMYIYPPKIYHLSSNKSSNLGCK